MKTAFTVLAFLLLSLLALEPLPLPAVHAQGLTFTLSTHKPTYKVGSQARVTLRLDSITDLTGFFGVLGDLGCQFDVFILDANRTPVSDGGKGVACDEALEDRSIPPAIVERATIPLRNNLNGRGDLAPGLYIIRGILYWSRLIATGELSDGALGPFSGEMVIEIIP